MGGGGLVQYPAGEWGWPDAIEMSDRLFIHTPLACGSRQPQRAGDAAATIQTVIGRSIGLIRSSGASRTEPGNTSSLHRDHGHSADKRC